MDSNLVSVIIPTYNRAHVVGRAMRSVLDQTYTQFELIVVDDGSTDDTAKEIFDFIDKRIVYVKHNSNRGVSAARNTGIKTAQGKYLAFLDSDDEWLPKKLEKQMSAIITTDDLVGVVYSSALYKYNKSIYFLPEWDNVQANSQNLLRLKCPVLLQVCIVKRDCFEKVGLFDEMLRMNEDLDMWIRISMYFHFLYVGEPLTIKYTTSGSLINDNQLLIEGYKQLLQKHFTAIRKDKEALAAFYFWIGHFLCAEGQMGEGRKYFIRYLKFKPLQIKAWYRFLKSLFGKSV